MVITRADLEKFDWFRLGYRANSFEGARELEIFRSCVSDLRVLIVMGEWCEDTLTQLPGFFKLLDQASFSSAQIEIYSVGRDKFEPGVTDRLKISQIPTFVFFDSKGRELGRIVESPSGSLLEDSVEIVTEQPREL